ncbi:MAG TPA: DUF2917 domain-containing protein [Burkholderiaceae bacterium]
MGTVIVLESQQWQAQGPASASAGCWRLEPGRAMRLSPAEAALLRVEQGRVWATFDGPHQGPLNDLGDLVIGAGEALHVAPRQRLVVEPFDTTPGAPPVRLRWEAVPPAARTGLGRALVALVLELERWLARPGLPAAHNMA